MLNLARDVLFKMAVLCLSCGEDISNMKGKKNLQTEASRHIFAQVFDEEIVNAGKEKWDQLEYKVPTDFDYGARAN